MTDHWIPGRPLHMLQTLFPIPEYAKVCSLMDGHGHWNEENVRAFFSEETVELILQTQISSHGGEDFVYWPHTRFGLYIVRSAYNLARSSDFFLSHSKNGRGLSSSKEVEEKYWKAIWAIKAPNKMNIVLWRFAHNCLPSGLQLRHRNIPTNPACVHCGRDESIEHCLLFCQFASEVWNKVKKRFYIHLCRKNFHSTKQWLFDFIDRASPEQSTVFAITVWHIWEARNAVRNGEGNIHPHRVASKIHAYVDLVLLHLFKTVAGHSHETPSSSSVKWSPPPPGSVLINVDAAIFSNLHKLGIGILIRNHKGECLVACTEPLKGMVQPKLAESWALRQAVILARDEGLTSVIFASDCLSLVQRVNSSSIDRSEVGVVVSDIKRLVACFSSVSFCHVKRSLNAAAHILARAC
uniref:Reverse transcriptase zinc-binding domain-containing protein n=1 Tax=Triticum urartu TaxID=4572 RepID=A0A8R7P8F8_TRIUA